MNAKTEFNPTETCETIKLGIAALAKWYFVGRQVDGATRTETTAQDTAKSVNCA